MRYHHASRSASDSFGTLPGCRRSITDSQLRPADAVSRMLPSERTVYELPQKLCRLHGHYVGTVPNRNSHPLARSLIFIPNSAVVCPREADVAVEICNERAIEAGWAGSAQVRRVHARRARAALDARRASGASRAENLRRTSRIEAGRPAATMGEPRPEARGSINSDDRLRAPVPFVSVAG